MTAGDSTYSLLDCGDGRRLERLGGVVVSRPAPAAAFPPSLPAQHWREADLVFERGSGWTGDAPEPWREAFGPVVLGLRPAGQGQVGVFPEHAGVGERMDTLLSRLPVPDGGWRALNLFAHTGLATLRLAARGDISVAHVDAAQAAVRQARENAALSGLEEVPIRWLVDEAMSFLAREQRRGSRYHVIMADPPAFGRGKRGEWKLSRDLPALLAAMAALIEPPTVLCLTCHSEGWNSGELRERVAASLPAAGQIETDILALRPEHGGRALPAGHAVYAIIPE